MGPNRCRCRPCGKGRLNKHETRGLLGVFYTRIEKNDLAGTLVLAARMLLFAQYGARQLFIVVGWHVIARRGLGSNDLGTPAHAISVLLGVPHCGLLQVICVTVFAPG